MNELSEMKCERCLIKLTRYDVVVTHGWSLCWRCFNDEGVV